MMKDSNDEPSSNEYISGTNEARESSNLVMELDLKMNQNRVHTYIHLNLNRVKSSETLILRRSNLDPYKN